MGVNYIELAKLNGNKPLMAGQEIKVPRTKLYRVVKGDNFYRISAKLKIPVKELIAFNKTSSSLYIGQLLKIPHSTTPREDVLPPLDEAPKIKAITESDTLKDRSPLRFIWPASGHLVLKYGTYDDIMHYGLRLKLKKKRIFSMEDGVVSYAGKMRGFGKTLMISHADNTVSLYAGLKSYSKKLGHQVNRGESIGLGKEILFFSLYQKGAPVDPAGVMQ